MQPIFLDFETYYSKDYSLKNISGQQYILSPEFKVHGFGCAFGKGQAQWYSGGTAKGVLNELIPGNVVVCHNANFDCAILEWCYAIKPTFIVDTVSLSRAIIGERLKSHSLDSIAKYLLQQEKGAYLSETLGVRDLTLGQEKRLADYCLKDVDLCRQIFYKLIPYMPKQDLKVADLISRLYCEPCLIIDSKLAREHHAQVVAKQLCAMDDAGVEDITTLRSNPQFAEALNKLGVSPPMKISPTTGKETFAFAKTDEGMLALAEHGDERVQALVAARLETRSTLAETRAKKFITASAFGALPVSYAFSGAMTTHRLSGQGGDNLQNLPRGGALRRAIMAPHGHTLIVGDLAQIELRITLALAATRSESGSVYEALKLLASGGDLYSNFGSMIYQTHISKETHPAERQVAKSAVLGLGFGMGKDKFISYCKQQGINIDNDMAGRVVKLYRDTYQEVVKLWWYLEERVKKFCFDGEFGLLFAKPEIYIGRTKLFNDVCIWLKDNLQIKYPELKYNADDRTFTYKRAMGETHMFGGKYAENLVQYLAAIINKEKMLELNTRYKVVMNSHDETVIAVRHAEVDEATEFMADVMRHPVPWWPTLPLGVEIKASERYGLAK